MKFQCDRCKKPYVIADERVRGKILKIRCKNCSAIITVREGMDRIGAAARSEDPGQRHSVIEEQGAVTESAPPGHHGLPGRQDTLPQDQLPALTRDPDLDPEWYLSVGGEQEGPYSLVDARKWISNRDADVEVYCWRDGFDDWRLVEEVPFLQKVRRRRQSKLILVPPPPHLEVEPTRSAEERLSSQGIRPSVVMAAVEPTNAGDLQLDIDEPSRLFSVTGLEAQGGEPTRQERGRLPGMSQAPPPQDVPFLNGEDAVPLAPARQRSVLPLLLIVVIIIVAAVAVVLWESRRGNQGEDDASPRTSSQSNLEDLGYRVEPGARKGAGHDAAPEAVPGDGSLTALTPDDVIRASSKSEMWFRRCYERAREKDPSLDVESIKIDITVSPDGALTEVKLSSHADTDLGQCIASGVRTWQFRASKAGIKSQLPLVFEHQQ